MTSWPLAPTTRLGSYELIRPLAHGGMAELYLARAPGPCERLVAVKVLSASRADDAEACAMFLDEARVVALLDHHNIAAVHEVDVADGRHYLAMEYVHGADLRELVAAAHRARTALPFDAAIAIVCAAAAGLDHAHRRCGPDGSPLRLVHRDVSLSNIMVGHDGAVKVVDFGIATTTIASVHTSPGVVRGKASYMSPEQCLGDRVDHRSDVFALGVVLYELTTGARCFLGRSDFDRMLAVVRTDYIAPSALVARFPAALEAVIRTALMADPQKRFASAAAMIEALERAAALEGWSGGAAAIQRVMRELFGEAGERDARDADEPRPSPGDDATVTERCSVVALPTVVDPAAVDPTAPPFGGDRGRAPTVDPTRPARRIARGTESGGIVDELEERTRGRAPLRLPWRAA